MQDTVSVALLVRWKKEKMEIDRTGKDGMWNSMRWDKTAEDRTSYITCLGPKGIREAGQDFRISHSMFY